MAHATLPLDLVELLERAAAHPDGTEPLLSGNLECAACLYQVHPDRVERAREAMAEPRLRALAAQILGRPRAPRPSAPTTPRLKDVSSLVSAAMRRPHGMEVLMEAPMELAAVQFNTHPFLIEEARSFFPHPAVATITPGVFAS